MAPQVRRARAGWAAIAATALLAIGHPPPAAAAPAPGPCADVASAGVFTFADRALAVGPAGAYYTSSGLTVTGRSGSTIVFTAEAPPAFSGLIDLAVAATNEVVALDSSGRIVRFDPSGTIIGTFDVGKVNVADASIAVHTDGRIWVADPFTDTLRAFRPDGAIDVEVGGGERPGDVEITPAGEVVTVDGFERVVRWHSDTGERLREVTIGHVNAGEVEVAVDLDGRVHLSDPFTDTVQVFASTGEHLLTVDGSEFPDGFERPITIEALPTGGVVVGDSFTETLHVITIPEIVGPAIVGAVATTTPPTVAVGEIARLVVTVSADAECPVGPFEVDRALPSGLTVEARSDDDDPWRIDLLGPAAPAVDFWLDVAASGGGTYDVSFELTGPGVAGEVIASIEVTASTTSTTATAPTSTAPTGQLPATGSSAWPRPVLLLAVIAIAGGLVLVGRTRRPRPRTPLD